MGGLSHPALAQTAQKRSERLKDVPLTVTVQTGEELSHAGVTNTRDLGIAIPGLSFQSQGNFAQPNLRGVSTTSTAQGADRPVAIYLDGSISPASRPRSSICPTSAAWKC